MTDQGRPFYDDTAVDEAIAELDANPAAELPISSEQLPKLTAAQRHRYERALYRAKQRLTPIAEAGWLAGENEAPPSGVWHWPDSPKNDINEKDDPR